MTKRPTFIIELTPVEGVVGDQSVRALRALLKVLGRAYGLRCTYAVEIRDNNDDEELPISGKNS